MNIGIVADNEFINDIRIRKEAAILKDHGNSIFVLCFAFRKDSYQTVEGISVTRIYLNPRYKNILFFLFNTIPLYEWLWAKKIRKFIIYNDIDVIHTHDLYMAKASASGIKASGRNIKLVLDLHENYPVAVESYNWTKGYLRRLISAPEKWKIKEGEYLGYADKIIVLSTDFRDELLKRYSTLKKENFCLFPNVPDMNRRDNCFIDRSKVKFSRSSPILFYFGVVAERRGIFNTLEAFKNILKKGHNAMLMIIGPTDRSDREKFISYISSEELSNQTIYIPWIDISELPTYLDISDICLAPFLKNAHHESGVANKIFDYMLGAKPIIASDCKPQKELIEKYNCGLIFSNQKEYEDSIITLLSDRDRRNKMGENGKRAIKNEFNLENLKGNLTSLYDEIKNSVNK